jgi:hypothetical protein
MTTLARRPLITLPSSLQLNPLRPEPLSIAAILQSGTMRQTTQTSNMMISQSIATSASGRQMPTSALSSAPIQQPQQQSLLKSFRLISIVYNESLESIQVYYSVDTHPIVSEDQVLIMNVYVNCTSRELSNNRGNSIGSGYSLFWSTFVDKQTIGVYFMNPTMTTLQPRRQKPKYGSLISCRANALDTNYSEQTIISSLSILIGKKECNHFLI